jgi:5,10-methylenetetrahydromethanopterin reductase
MARKVKKLLDDIEWAEAAGLDTAWMPQVPNDFDCLTMVSLMGSRTSRIELGTAVVPLQAQHPIALARQALSIHAGVGGRLALGVGPSHHWIVRDMLGIPYEKPAAYTRDYLEVLNVALAGPGDVDVENDTFTVHNPTVLGTETPMPVLVAALGPVMLQIAGELADGTVLWMADERAIGGQRWAACAAHRRWHPGVPVRQLRDWRCEGAGQPHPRRGRDIAQLPEAAGSR